MYISFRITFAISFLRLSLSQTCSLLNQIASCSSTSHNPFISLTYKYLGSTIFGIWIAEGKPSICFHDLVILTVRLSLVILILRTSALWGQNKKILFGLSFILVVSLLTYSFPRPLNEYPQCVIGAGVVVTRSFLQSVVCECFRTFKWRWRTDGVLAVFPAFPPITSCNFGGSRIIIYNFLIVMVVESSMYYPFVFMMVNINLLL
jgi:hypothetical protein